MSTVEHYLSSGLVITNDRAQGLVMSIPYRLPTVADGDFVFSLFHKDAMVYFDLEPAEATE